MIVGSTDAILTITYTNESSPATVGGDYTCTADGANQQHFYVGLAPYITPPTDTLAAIGDSVSLICEAAGLPTPNISWERVSDGMALTGLDTNPNNYSVQSTLTITVAAGDYEGYTCTASSGAFMSDNGVDVSGLTGMSMATFTLKGTYYLSIDVCVSYDIS